MSAGRRLSSVLLLLGIVTLPGLGRAKAADEAWPKQIAELEARLFEPVLPADEVDRLLDKLKQADIRAKAAKRLAEQGQGHVARVITFAHDCPDMEARQACADVVEALDSSYRTTELGKQLGAIYREQTEALLPAYWARFRQDPLDPCAVAMLMHADAEKAYTALGKTADRHDQVRYLLLRIRELSPDEYAAKHIEEHTAARFLRVMPDVFLGGAHRDGPQCYGRVHRAVGQTYLHVLRLGTTQEFDSPPGNLPDPFNSKPAGAAGLLPKIQYIEFASRRVNLFFGSKCGVCSWPVGCCFYSSQTVRGYNSRLGSWGIDDGLCPLPRLTLTEAQRSAIDFHKPWWIKPYLPAAYHTTTQFTEQGPGERAPEAIAARFSGQGTFVGKRASRTTVPLDPAAPSVVMLPPRLPRTADASAISAAELVCDRLAEELAAEGIARVVDRTQLDRVLQEKRLSADVAKPLVGYDAMIRLEVEVPSLVPTIRLSLIDLSHGNVMREEGFGWPMQETDLPKMVGHCRDALKQVGQLGKDKLKVRCMEVENQEQNPRLAPLVRRLGQVFEEAVARSPRLTSVRHLEATSAKEESLLLLMGLSRLPGGRRFVPQADAAIEFRLRERDGRGKTFEETPVEIAVRITRGNTLGNADHEQSFVSGGTVGQFDRAAAQAWEKLAGLLHEAQPGAATGWLDDLAVRRRQAEVELRAARNIIREAPGSHDEQKLLARLAHAEAAVKLDPTLEEAAYEHLVSLESLSFGNWAESRRGPTLDLEERFLAGAAEYFDRFGDKAAHRHEVHDACRLVIHTSLGSLCFSGGLELPPQRLRMIEKAKLILEDAVKYSGHSLGADYQAMTLSIVGRAMKRTGVPLAERQQWVDRILQWCAQGEAKLTKSVSRYTLDGYCREYNHVWLRAAELAVEDGSMDRARKLIAQLQERLEAINKPWWENDTLIRGLRGLVVKTDDASAVLEFDRWTKQLGTNVVHRLEVRWPTAEVFQDREQVGKDSFRSVMPSITGIWIRRSVRPNGEQMMAISALVEGEKCLYLVMDLNPIHWGHFEALGGSSRSQVIACMPLDKEGRPIGNIHRITYPIGNELRDSLKVLPQPPVDKPLQVLDAKYLAGKLYLGTLNNGLLVFDPKTEKWSSFGSAQGLPEEGVFSIYLLDDRTLFCVGKKPHHESCVCYTVELPEGKVTLLHRAVGERVQALPRWFWREGGRLLAWSQIGLCDDLLGREFRFTRRSPGVPYGWNAPGGRLDTNYPAGFISMAEVGGRRFITNAGLHEFDATGKIVRSWWGSNRYEDDYGHAYSVLLTSDCPIQSNHMIAMGTMLVFVDSGSVLAWDPKTDTWYGPLAPGGEHAVGTRAGVWLGTCDGVQFVSADDLLSAAKSAGRVMTTAQYRQRQREIIAAMRPLDRAKAAFSMHQFDKAEQLLDQLLKDDPKSAEALLLMGDLHDLWCTNKPEEALRYYQRLAELKTNPNASFTGMYQRLILLRTQKRWPEALATIDEIQHNYPRLSEYHQGDIDWWRNYISKQLAEKDPKPPPVGTSNKAERPAP